MNCKKVLIVEDDYVSGKMLEKIIIKMGYFSMGIEASAESTLLRIMKDQPDLILMDIELSGEMDGIHIAKILSKYNNVPIVFVTSHEDKQTMIRAKDVGLGFIVKPFLENEIKAAIEKHLEPVAKNNVSKEADVQAIQVEKVIVKNCTETVFLNLYSIDYFESEGHTIHIHTKEATYSLRGSLSFYEKIDKLHCFIRCHKSFLVNLAEVEAIINSQGNYKIKLKGSDSRIELSRNKVKSVKESIKGYIR